MDHWKKSETTISCDEIQSVNSQGWIGVKETLIMLVKLMIGIAFLNICFPKIILASTKS